MTNRKNQYNNCSHRAMAVTLDSANSDFHLGDIESQIVPQYISEAAAGKKKKKKKKKKSDATEWKNENTNLLIVTSAACSGETAGCQTLKGTGAEFNASCQESLMWLSPPARAGIVKLSGAGKDAQTALRDALSLSPLQEHRSGRNRGWETSTIFTKVCVCACAHVWIHMLTWFFCSSSLLFLLML